ncbi:uncharacterized protein PV07_12847 [Cladophialophora immunda]|uniref:Uncharacterized protein n=1 Tax=Cladophialophora immunda TaxID=569365 RepID=A0A0D1Z215_9EURO|nr:uncharacterized protein PV07_12847 [Cladophialophora immunda]KIW21721.1 hypothetical protein PV07_12847 [Cladophialophora immunda]
MEENILAQIYWYNICPCFQNGKDFEKWLLGQLPPSTKVYGVFWTSDDNIPFQETRAHAVVTTKIAVPKNDQVREIEKCCKIEHGSCKAFADAQRAESGDLGWIVKAIEGKPARGNPEIFGNKLQA